MTNAKQSLDLDAIEARANSATEGPWRTTAKEPLLSRISGWCVGLWSAGAGRQVLRHSSEWKPNTSDFEFIAAARTDVPALVEEVRRVIDENECDACAGTGNPVSGLPCMCGGTGKMSVAALHLRKRAVDAEIERDQLRAENEQLRNHVAEVDFGKRYNIDIREQHLEIQRILREENRQLKERFDNLRQTISDIICDGCEYGDDCPPGAKHYVCQSCQLQRALDKSEKGGE